MQPNGGSCRALELCGSRGGRPGLRERSATLNSFTTQLRNFTESEVAVLGSPSLIVHTVFVDVSNLVFYAQSTLCGRKVTLNRNQRESVDMRLSCWMKSRASMSDLVAWLDLFNAGLAPERYWQGTEIPGGGREEEGNRI